MADGGRGTPANCGLLGVVVSVAVAALAEPFA